MAPARKPKDREPDPGPVGWRAPGLGFQALGLAAGFARASVADTDAEVFPLLRGDGLRVDGLGRRFGVTSLARLALASTFMR